MARKIHRIAGMQVLSWSLLLLLLPIIVIWLQVSHLQSIIQLAGAVLHHLLVALAILLGDLLDTVEHVRHFLIETIHFVCC